MPTRGPHLDLPDYDGNDGPASGPTLVHWALFALGAARRRKALAAAVFLLGTSALTAYYLIKTPTYRVEAKILTQRQQALPSLVRPAAPDEAPTRTAWELVHRQQNVLALIKQTDLLSAQALASSNRQRNRVLGDAPAADEDPLNALVVRLDRALHVTTDDGSIIVSIDWPDAQQAYRLVEAAVQNFLEARHLQEVTAIDEVISVLQGRVATLRDQLDKVVAEETRRGAAREADVPRSPRRAQPDEELVRLKSILDAKHRAIADVEDFRRRRLAELQAQLDERRGIYSEAHPSVQSLRQDVEALSQASPQIASLREEEEKLRKEYAARLAQAPASISPMDPWPVRALPGPSNASLDQNERVREARFQYQQMVERVNAAQVELDAARTVFKYRYSVSWPAQVPKKPVSPKPLKIFGVGLPGVLVFSILIAAALDLRAGRITERWQVERALDLTVLGELERK